MSPLPPAKPGYDTPLELLHACHIRMEQRCALLLELCHHLEAEGADQRARNTADVLLRYFDDAAAEHHEDEEQDLFPALLAASTPQGRAFIERLVDQLESHHREMETLYAQIRERLTRLVAGEAAPLDPGLCDRLHTLYLVHIQLEEDELMPLARERLSAAALHALGARMAARRGVTLEPTA